MKKRLYTIVAILFVLVPLGLLSPYAAWGEWENDHYKELLGFIPKGIAEADGVNAPIPDYALSGISDAGSYYLSALLGVLLLFGIYYILLKVLKNEKSH